MNREGMEEQTGQRRTSNYALIRAHSKYMYKKKVIVELPSAKSDKLGRTLP